MRVDGHGMVVVEVVETASLDGYYSGGVDVRSGRVVEEWRE